MKNTNTHIISSFRWDTSFDEKEKGSQLQERLSRWSRINMQREISTVLNKICPPEQTWKIETLEIDLGQIDYDYLEFELTAKFFKQLHDKLIDLIIYANQNGRINIKIYDADGSHLDVLKSFLLQGLMSWSYKSVDGTVNQILSSQLKNNRQNLIAMIREIGASNDQVRNRISLQVSETNIIKVIEGLEPNNHAQIIEFSEKLSGIQAKKSIVKTNSVDFKKNLWHWILNYLLTERGTIFNKIAFMKSSIKQMANHYNISYNELFELIKRAVDDVKEKLNINADFVITLKALSKQNEDLIKKNDFQNETFLDPWEVLEDFLKNYSLQKNNSQKIEFNELVIGLFMEDRSKFKTLILSVGKSENIWINAIKNLNNHSLEVIFNALNPAGSVMMVDTIYLLEKMVKETNLNIQRNDLWEIATKFLVSKNHSLNDNKSFLNYFISGLSVRKQITRENIVDKLVVAKIRDSSKTISALDIYTNLVSVLFSERSAQDEATVNEYFNGLTAELINLISGLPTNKTVFIETQKSLIKNIELNPKHAITCWTNYHDKNGLAKLMPYIVNDRIAKLLIKNSRNELRNVVFLTEQILKELSASAKSNSLADLLSKKLMPLVVNALIFKGGFSASQLFQIILQEFSGFVNSAEAEQFDMFIDKLFADKRILALEIPAEFVVKMKRQENLPKQFAIEQVNELIVNSPRSHAEIEKILLANFSDKQFIEFRNKKENELLLNYFVGGGKALMKDLVKQYTEVIAKQLKQVSREKIEQIVKELYWKCILNYSIHKGKSEVMKRSLSMAILNHFPVSKIDPVKMFSRFGLFNKQDSVQMKNGDKIFGDELFVLIKQGFSNNSVEIVKNSSVYHLEELIRAALKLGPSELRNIISRLPDPGKQILLLEKTVSFNEFTCWIMQDTAGAVKAMVDAMRLFFDFTTSIASVGLSKRMLHDYWKETLRLIKTNAASEQNLKTFIKNSLKRMAQETDFEAISIEIKRNGLIQNSTLRNVLLECVPASSIQAPDEIAKLPSSELVRSEQKGLLDDLSSGIIMQKQVPAWFGNSNEEKVTEYLNEIVTHYPVKFLLVLKNEIISEQQMSWLSRKINFKELIHSIGNLNKNRQPLLSILEKFYESIRSVSVRGISAGEIQEILFRKILKAWVNDNWKIISTENIWNELIWEACTRRGVLKKDFIRDIEKVKYQFPVALQISFGYLIDQSVTVNVMEEEVLILKKKEKLIPKKDKEKVSRGGISVNNAGLVLVNNYIPILFERLGIMINKKFTDPDLQSKAIHYLQYAVTGLSNTEEHLLPLNKVLSGLPLSQPVPGGITISDDHKKIINGLISAVINHWPSIGKCSVNGFRGNWMVRNGLLIELEDKWELVVEKKVYDVLIHKFPFSFSIIKYPWMNKPLHVTWQY